MKKEVLKIFEGHIFHKRIAEKNHSFDNKSLFLLINIKKLSRLLLMNSFKSPSLFSINKFNFLSWYCSDHGERKINSSPKDLLIFLKKLEKEKEFDDIYLFCFPRSLGFGFNPLSIYFCYIKKNLVKTIFEVKNTFGDIHHYILPNVQKNGIKQKVKKKLFVSPFFDNEGHYELSANFINKKIFIEINYFKFKKLLLSANLKAIEIHFTNTQILKSFFKFLSFPGKNLINIHLEALKLWTKKIKIYKTPKEQSIKYSKAVKIE